MFLFTEIRLRYAPRLLDSRFRAVKPWDLAIIEEK